MSTQIILASTSPRRSELLTNLGITFEVLPSNAPEDFEDGMDVCNVVKMLAERKASVIADEHPGALIIAADTVVSFENKILGKPASDEEAFETLKSLSGQTHQVISGVALIGRNLKIFEIFAVVTDVTFSDFDEKVIRDYIKTGEPLDKAGGYGIQSKGAVLVQRINGSYHNVVGLPVFELAEALRKYAKVIEY